MVSLFVSALTLTTSAVELKLASPFTDHMVLQRETGAPIWGWGEPGTTIEVNGSWNRSVAKAKVAPDGKWMVKLKTPRAGGPYEVTVRGGTTITLKDVLIGEVWVCSGQSNMEWTLAPQWQGQTEVGNWKEEVAGANKPQIRLLNVPRVMTAQPLETIKIDWKVCSPETVKNFSAVGYLYGKYLNSAINMPIGLINTSYGGTEVELWTSEAGLRRHPELGAAVDAKIAAASTTTEAAREREALIKSDEDRPDWIRSEVGWAVLKTAPNFEKMGFENFDGSVWFRATIELTPGQSVSKAILNLGAIDDEDTTWVNGKKIGGQTVWNESRSYVVPDGLLVAGKNTIVVRVLDTLSNGGFANAEDAHLEVGGYKVKLVDWMFRKGIDLTGKPAPSNQIRAAGLYNAMVHPLIPYGIRGAIWYQGESNVSRAYQYRSSFPAMVKDWRTLWKQGDFPFYFVQIAPFNYNSQGQSAELREAQLLATKSIPNSGMVVTTDLVDNLADIHPSNKIDVAERLSRIALRRTYGFRNVSDRGPTFKNMKIEGDKIRLNFDDANGLEFRGGTALGFTIAGSDLVFAPANAVIQGKSIVVSAPGVLNPQAVRFGWGDAPVLNLFNGAGLPASPFRTDDFPLLTRNVRW